MTRIVLLLLDRRFVPMSESWNLPFIIFGEYSAFGIRTLVLFPSS